MTDTNSHQPAGTVTGDIAQLPARTVTARKTAVGAQKHFACSFVHGAGAGFVMNTDSLTEKKVAFLLFARPDVVKLENQLLFRWQAKDGTWNRHFFDFRVTMTSGARIAIMVKYDKKLSDEEFRKLPAKKMTQVIAKKMFPEICKKHTKRVKCHDGVVDALMIGVYAKRDHFCLEITD